MERITCWVFDADDTLWESAGYFRDAEDSFVLFMGNLGFSPERVREEVHSRDVERLPVTGYGPGPYIETLRSILTDFVGKPTEDAFSTLERIRDRLTNHPVTLFPGVLTTLESLSKLGHRLILYTMGEKKHQEEKYEKSGLSGLFEDCVVVPRKTPESLEALMDARGLNRGEVCVVGNSPRSNIAPALHCGVNAIYVKRPCTWAAEHRDIPVSSLLATVSHISDIPMLLRPDRTGGQWNC
ncbi:MAG: HAD hydrolase-like protein [Candidatus Fermentibacteraceae bacterium]